MLSDEIIAILKTDMLSSTLEQDMNRRLEQGGEEWIDEKINQCYRRLKEKYEPLVGTANQEGIDIEFVNRAISHETYKTRDQLDAMH